LSVAYPVIFTLRARAELIDAQDCFHGSRDPAHWQKRV